ncbi:MAG: oxidative damage protection protein [Ketobacteraceae bacterium]|nr:oxidative damage protection protein [Ketobacteraceae bacterium]
MAKTVFCRKYKTELEALAAPPFPGPKGQKIQETISKKAWMEWLKHQTMMINEKHLNVLDPGTQSYLETEMEKFMDGDDYEKPEGYVPPEKGADS